MASIAPKPLIFMVMPFGKKRDPTERYEIDFDLVYERAIKSAASAFDLDVVRADEEIVGGFVHIAMYERLLLAEIVVADLTLANPNVFYELGVRHAARPRSTILMFAKIAQVPSSHQLPFDLAPIRAIPYELEEGILSEDQAQKLEKQLRERIKYALNDTETKDSPLFQLIKDYPGIRLAHEVTETFRDRVKFVSVIRDSLKNIRCETDHVIALKKAREIGQSIAKSKDTLPELLIDLMLTFRDLEGWDDIITLIDSFPSNIKNSVTVQEQFALALNRRNAPGDRRRAIAVLQAVLDEHGPSSETFGILGRIYKDAYEENLKEGNSIEAQASLENAISAYRSGFEADPRDYYPGINLVTLLLRKGTEEALYEMAEVRPVVSFAVTRRGGLKSRDYWDLATVLELSVTMQDWQTATRASGQAILQADAPWNLRTTARNLSIIRDVYAKRGINTTDLEALIQALEDAAKQMRS